jgi:hypothetical protein
LHTILNVVTTVSPQRDKRLFPAFHITEWQRKIISLITAARQQQTSRQQPNQRENLSHDLSSFDIASA